MYKGLQADAKLYQQDARRYRQRAKDTTGPVRVAFKSMAANAERRARRTLDLAERLNG